MNLEGGVATLAASSTGFVIGITLKWGLWVLVGEDAGEAAAKKCFFSLSSALALGESDEKEERGGRDLKNLW